MGFLTVRLLFLFHRKSKNSEENKRDEIYANLTIFVCALLVLGPANYYFGTSMEPHLPFAGRLL